MTALLIIEFLSLHAYAAAAAGEIQPEDRLRSDPEKNVGIKILSLRPTAAGQMLDLRFQVVDPDKAKAVLDKNTKAYLVDGKSGKTLPVPLTKAGSMRQTTLKPEAGRTYFMLFSNPGGLVKEGGSVSLLVGDFRRDGIIVDGSGAVPVPTGNSPLQKSGSTGAP